MTKLINNKFRRLLFCLVAALSLAPISWAGVYQHGTVVRMRMGDCLPAHHGFMVAFGGQQTAQAGPDVCPEYTLISDKVVFVIVGRSSNQLVPLADDIDFRLQKNELAVRIDDARHESRFSIKEMILRSEWDMVQKHIADQLSSEPQNEETRLAMRSRE